MLEKAGVGRITEADGGIDEKRLEDSVIGRWESFHTKAFNLPISEVSDQGCKRRGTGDLRSQRSWNNFVETH